MKRESQIIKKRAQLMREILKAKETTDFKDLEQIHWIRALMWVLKDV